MSPHKLDMMASEGGDKEKSNWIMGQEAFEAVMPHHESIEALWEKKWKFPCSKSVYPFHDGELEDFGPVFQHLIENNINDGTFPAYTRAFFPIAESLTTRGDSASTSNPSLASEYYLRAACLYRISRFPYITSSPKINDEVKWDAWERQKEVYMKAARIWEQPIKEVMIQHVHAKEKDREVIPVYLRMPKSATSNNEKGGKEKVPMVLLLTGLDGYRPDNTQRSQEFIDRGWGTVIVEIPGTADCPSDPSDPESPDRLWSSIFEWMEEDGRFDMDKILVWGLSAGGYYAIRIAHTHKERLRGSVAQGAGSHYFFGKEWIDHADGHEYPFLLSPALAMKHGYESVEAYREGVQKKFSLLENGILDQPSTRLLLINGTKDGLMPIEDSMLLFGHGNPKEARFFSGALHMGYPMANASVYPWMEEVMNGRGI